MMYLLLNGLTVLSALCSQNLTSNKNIHFEMILDVGIG